MTVAKTKRKTTKKPAKGQKPARKPNGNGAPDLTDITVVLDRSGSMGMVKKDTIGGFNTFLAEQQAQKGRCIFSLMQFDTEYEDIYQGADIASVKPLDETTFVPRGMTALNDAIGRTIQQAAQRDDGKRRILFVIVTDGGENSSVEFKDTAKVKALIKQYDAKQNWDFVYIGANQDAFTVGTQTYGVAGVGKTMTAAATGAGFASAFVSAASYVSRGRGSATLQSFKSNAFTQEDRDAQAKAFNKQPEDKTE